MQCLYKRPNHNTSLYNMKLKGELCDATIKVNGKSIYAHKAVLAASFNYFHSMFLHSFREKNQNEIHLKDIEETNMETLVKFAYTGEILITESNAFSLLVDTNYLDEVGIKEACIKFLESHLSSKKVSRCPTTSLIDFQVWQFARATGCSSLENVARENILSHFDTFSQTDDYFKSNLETLKPLLSDERLHSEQFRKILFDGIMRWVMYDAENRRIHVRELLNVIKATNVRADYVMSYLCEIVTDDDYEYIEKSILSFYRSKINPKIGMRTQGMGLSLIVTNRRGKDIELQFYDFFERKWCEIKKIAHGNEYFDQASCVILNSQLYLVQSTAYDAQLEIIDFKIEQSKMIMNKIPRGCALGADTKRLYLCGGFNIPSCGKNEYLNEILEYDPETDFIVTLTQLKFPRCYAAIIFHQKYLYVLGGCRIKVAKGDTQEIEETNLVERYDLETKEWSDVTPMCESRFNFGVTILNGKLYACGGPDSRSVEVYDPLKNNWQKVADMKKKRWDFVVVALEGKLLAIGGDKEATVEVYYPCKDEWILDPELSSGLKLEKPTGGLIQISCIFNDKKEVQSDELKV